MAERVPPERFANGRLHVYAGNRYGQHPDRAAFIMASTGESVTYADLEQRSNRLAHLLRGEGLRRLDHYAVFMSPISVL